MVDYVENEVLIALVEVRPVLWDTTVDIFSDRAATKKAWYEVCDELHEGFAAFGDTDKEVFAKEIMRKWRNIRDSFIRSQRKLEMFEESEISRKKPRRYVYSRQLQFLNKHYDKECKTEEIFIEDEAFSWKSFTEIGEATNSATDAAVTTTPKAATPTKTKKQSKPDEIKLDKAKALDHNQIDSKMSFFRSLLPYLDKFDNDQMLKFQMSVLQIISNLNEGKM